MVDQLSMNFGKNKTRNTKKSSEKNIHDSNSVVSILTKGGTVVNPFNSGQSHQRRGNGHNAKNQLGQSKESRFNKNQSLTQKKNQKGLLQVASGDLNVAERKL
jgi:hypothetical protein